MSTSKAAILAQLQRDILPLQGLRTSANGQATDVGLAAIETAFPNNSFPLGAMHEFLCNGAETLAASSGFIAGVLSALMKAGGVTLWISANRTVFPPALQAFGIEPHRVIFIDLKRTGQLLWAMEEALKCKGLASVVGEINEIDFTTSRRLQLAVEGSGVTGFLLRQNPRSTTTACVTRWKIAPLASTAPDGLPGLGFPSWNVSLVKVRNGTPGTWQMEWLPGGFRAVHKATPRMSHAFQKKAV
jgi:protein ImuA